jgi:hypothetical protein
MEGKGCDMCNGTGYKGRLGIFEAIITDDTIEELLNKKPSEQEVRRVADKQGLLNMREDGAIKILSGKTSFHEVSSVVDMDIREITKTDKTVEKPTNHSEIIDSKKMDKVLSLHPESTEISLLIDYLKSLEHEQTINPDIDASERIALLQHTIMELLEKEQVKKDEHHEKLYSVADELKNLYHEQKNNPQGDISNNLKNIREKIEDKK